MIEGRGRTGRCRHRPDKCKTQNAKCKIKVFRKAKRIIYKRNEQARSLQVLGQRAKGQGQREGVGRADDIYNVAEPHLNYSLFIIH